MIELLKLSVEAVSHENHLGKWCEVNQSFLSESLYQTQY
ncbi:hypothetical protein NUACC26_049820 [Scytonema sp. NUACC26]